MLKINAELRQIYRSKLIVYYFNKQEYKDMDSVRRQVTNMDDKALQIDYNRVFKG